MFFNFYCREFCYCKIALSCILKYIIPSEMLITYVKNQVDNNCKKNGYDIYRHRYSKIASIQYEYIILIPRYS